MNVLNRSYNRMNVSLSTFSPSVEMGAEWQARPRSARFMVRVNRARRLLTTLVASGGLGRGPESHFLARDWLIFCA
jgi:hypothetical protein